MSDLLAGAEPDITLDEQIACVEREIKMRESAYPRWVDQGRMKQGEADRQITVMKAVLETVKLWAGRRG